MFQGRAHGHLPESTRPASARALTTPAKSMRGEHAARAKYSHAYYDNVKSPTCSPSEPIPDEAGLAQAVRQGARLKLDNTE